MTLDVAALRERHKPRRQHPDYPPEYGLEPVLFCTADNHHWPCEVVQLIDALAAEQQRVAGLRAALEQAADALEFIRPEITGRWLLAGDQRDQHEGAYRQQHEVVIAARDGARAALAATAQAVEGADER